MTATKPTAAAAPAAAAAPGQATTAGPAVGGQPCAQQTSEAASTTGASEPLIDPRAAAETITLLSSHPVIGSCLLAESLLCAHRHMSVVSSSEQFSGAMHGIGASLQAMSTTKVSTAAVSSAQSPTQRGTTRAALPATLRGSAGILKQSASSPNTTVRMCQIMASHIVLQLACACRCWYNTCLTG
jgi:hypothetical protein